MTKSKDSIVRESDIVIGDTVYREWFGTIQQIVILSLVHIKNKEHRSHSFSGIIVNGTYNTGVQEIFLGDAGMPGYTYDDRPSTLFTTKQAATASIGKYSEWLTASRIGKRNTFGILGALDGYKSLGGSSV